LVSGNREPAMAGIRVEVELKVFHCC
jgi:hypothetical protein